MVSAYMKKSKLGYYNVGMKIGTSRVHLKKFHKGRRKDAIKFFQQKKRLAKEVNKK